MNIASAIDDGEVLQPTAAVRSLVETLSVLSFQVLCVSLLNCWNKSITSHELHQIALSIVGQCLHYRFGHQVDQFLIMKLNESSILP